MKHKAGNSAETRAKTHLQRFHERYEVQPDGCWVWTWGKDRHGYGTMVVGRIKRAHRWGYEQLRGPIPEGLELDHLCRNKSCVNPDHLEPVTHKENMRRGDGASTVNAAKTHCPKGHPYAGENLLLQRNGERRCRECNRQQSLAWKAKRADRS